MNAAQIIRISLAEVKRLQDLAALDAGLDTAVRSIKRYQSLRFQHSYNDLITGGPYQSAAKFFLTELYGEVDFSARDAQFSSMAGTIERLLPAAAVASTVSLAKLHALTEQLDHAMAKAWTAASDCTSVAEHYVNTWKRVGREDLRLHQLQPERVNDFAAGGGINLVCWPD